MAEALCDQLFADVLDGEFHHPSDLFGILEAWEDCVSGGSITTSRGEAALLSSAANAATPMSAANGKRCTPQGGRDDTGGRDDGIVLVQGPAKRQRCSPPVVTVDTGTAPGGEGGAAKATGTSHIAVERNRRKQMNEHLVVLRSLMPCFYVKRVRSWTVYFSGSICRCPLLHDIAYYCSASVCLLATPYSTMRPCGTKEEIALCMTTIVHLRTTMSIVCRSLWSSLVLVPGVDLHLQIELRTLETVKSIASTQ
jgi:hypothetical protein